MHGGGTETYLQTGGGSSQYALLIRDKYIQGLADTGGPFLL